MEIFRRDLARLAETFRVPHWASGHTGAQRLLSTGVNRNSRLGSGATPCPSDCLPWCPGPGTVYLGRFESPELVFVRSLGTET